MFPIIKKYVFDFLYLAKHIDSLKKMFLIFSFKRNNGKTT